MFCVLSATIAIDFPINTVELCEKYNGSPNSSYLCTSMGDTIIKNIPTQKRYFKNNFEFFLLLKKNINVRATKMTIPDHFIYHNTATLRNER